MKLQRIRVQNYKCIDDTGWVEIDDLTCLIGKNEAGKTVLMKALERLNPAHDGDGFTPYDDYPRREWPEYQDRHETDPDPVITAAFGLADDEREQLREHGADAPDGTVRVTRDYANELHWELEVDAETVDDADAVGNEVLAPSLPVFHYVGEYKTLDGEIDVDSFVDRREQGALTESDQVFESLLSVAGLDADDLRERDDWRRTLTELETASSEITRSVTRYWSQADDLEIDLRSVGGNGDRTFEIRVENPHHGVTVEFDRRSMGFRWFFSTFCTVYDLRQTDGDVVLLLDEPGLHLHPKAKQEFLQFLETEFATGNVLMYSTHSPFMIDINDAHRTKMVSKDPETGSTVLTDPSRADSYTRFPLQNVFELGVMETLISRSRLLLVEDGTTYEYLYNVSELLEGTDAPTLDRGWTVLPIGTLENTHTVRSVFDTTGREVAVVHDGTDPDGWEPPGDVTAVGIGTHAPVTGRATVEDLLSEEFYLALVSRAYAGELSAAEVPDRLTSDELAAVATGGPIVDRVATYFAERGIANGSFDRSRQAAYLQTNREEFADAVDMDTRKAFGALNRALNDTLETVGDGRRSQQSFLDSLLGR